jgi:CBS domain-containing protein
MAKTARDVMKSEVKTVSPDVPLAELEKLFVENRVTGFPVVENGRLVGVVSRSDIVRKIVAENSYAEYLSDFYRDIGSFDEPAPADSRSELGSQVGSRLGTSSVRDVMSQEPVTVEADAPVARVARLLIERRIHRVPVVSSGGQLEGIISSLDLVRLLVD